MLSIEPSPINVPTFKQQVRARKGERTLKRLIWGYFILLIFEGALRKWVLPSLATPLLIVRDPVGIIMILIALRHGWLKMNFYLLFTLIVSFLALSFALVIGHGNMFVALYGLRIMLIHFPLIFIIAKVFSKKEVIQIGHILLWITIPMTVLVALQFYSPQSAWVNRGVGGDLAGGGFSGALGYFRPPGTFSFTNGLTNFYGLIAAYIFFFLLDNQKQVEKWLIYASAGCLLMAVPLSISRALLWEVVVSVLFAMAMIPRKPKLMKQVLGAVFVLALLIVIISTTPLFQTGMEVFITRFESANEIEGGTKGVLVDRFLGGMYAAITNNDKLPFWGYGIGMGTNVGAKLMTGSTGFLISEGEWGRLIGEMGLVLGLIYILTRSILGLRLFAQSFQTLKKGNFLPWMLLSFSLLNLIQGQWAQPTALGFAVLSTGLTMAALRERRMI